MSNKLNVPLHALSKYLQSRSASRPMAQETASAFAAVEYRTDEVHRHDYFEIYVVDQGFGLCVADGARIHIRPRTVFVIPPGTMHYWVTAEQMDGFIARIPLIEGHARLTAMDMALEVFQLNEAVCPHLLSLLRWIVEDDPRDDSRRSPTSRLKWQLLFESLSSEAQKSALLSDAKTPSDISAAFMALLERKYHLRWGVQDYAKALKVSRSSLLRAVQATYERSPADLIQLRTLKEAERLLLTTNDTCALISDNLGYVSQAQFTRAFSSYFKEAPSIYRQKRKLDRALTAHE